MDNYVFWITDGRAHCGDEPSILLRYDRAVLRVHREAAQQSAETEVSLMLMRLLPKDM